VLVDKHFALDPLVFFLDEAIVFVIPDAPIGTYGPTAALLLTFFEDDLYRELATPSA